MSTTIPCPHCQGTGYTRKWVSVKRLAQATVWRNADVECETCEGRGELSTEPEVRTGFALAPGNISRGQSGKLG